MTLTNMITEKHKCMLYKDDCGDPLLLTKHAEIFKFSDTVLGVWLWSKEKLRKLQAMVGTLEGIQSGYHDGLYVTYIKAEDLTQVLNSWGFKRRPHKEGNWLANKEDALGHTLTCFRPKLGA